MGYLVCVECSGHYKLKEGESPEDFVCCPCGGKLKYVKSLENSSNIPETLNKSSETKFKSIRNGAFLNISSNKYDNWLTLRDRIDVFSLLCIMTIILGIGGMMFTNSSIYPMAPASEVMVNASNEEFNYDTALLTSGKSKYPPYNESDQINGTWGTLLEVSEYKYTPNDSLKPNTELEENTTFLNSDELEKRSHINETIDQIGADEAKFPDRQGVCSDLNCFLTLGYGDCWADSYYLFDRCKNAGIKVRIVCCNNKLHRWVQIDKGAGWEDWEYTKYNSQHFGGAVCYIGNYGYYVLPGYST